MSASMLRALAVALAVALARAASLAAQDVPAPVVDRAHEPEAVAPAPPGDGTTEVEALPSGHPVIDPHAGVLPPGAADAAEGGGPLPSGHPLVGATGGTSEGHVAAAATPAGHGMGAMGDAAIERMFAPPEVATAEPEEDLPPGSIRVIVVDEHDTPVADAEIELGVMRSAGDRERLLARSGPDGTYVYEGLATGAGQAYRVNVLHEGATYSSTPFQLPTDTGYSSRVRRLPTTHDDRLLFQFVAQVLVELRDDRLHVIVQSQFVNMAEATYVFPGDGTQMRLPEGFIAFQSQAVMSDQHVTEVPGHGVRIHGSLPPGSVTLAWGFDVPVSGGEATLRFGNPFRTMRYRVISEAPAGLAMDVEGFPRARRVESDGQILLATELGRRPTDEPLEEVRVRLRGIPGPGPLRWIALGFGVALVAGGVLRLGRRRGAAVGGAARRLEELSRRRDELFAAARALDAEHAAGEIGDEYRQKRRDAIVMELAGLLYREDRLRESAPAAPVDGRSKTESGTRTGTVLAGRAKKKSAGAPSGAPER